jgi:hypothetical protein
MRFEPVFPRKKNPFLPRGAGNSPGSCVPRSKPRRVPCSPGWTRSTASTGDMRTLMNSRSVWSRPRGSPLFRITDGPSQKTRSLRGIAAMDHRYSCGCIVPCVHRMLFATGRHAGGGRGIPNHAIVRSRMAAIRAGPTRRGSLGEENRGSNLQPFQCYFRTGLFRGHN